MASELVADCPRCGAKKITFDASAQNYVYSQHGWQPWFEVFSICRNCGQSTTFILGLDNYDYRELATKGGPLAFKDGSLNNTWRIRNFVSLKDMDATPAPDHVPADIKGAFDEGARSVSGGNPNAAGTMFRLCIDLATRPLLPPPPQEGQQDKPGLNAKVRRDLGLRLPWLFDNHLLPEALRELSSCIKEDGNDGAHSGKLKMEDADDLLDFAVALLERMYTEPERLKLAKARRDERRAKS